MPEVSFPGDGQAGEQPPPADPARDGATETPADGRLDGPAGSARARGDACQDDRAEAPVGPDDGVADDGWLPGAPAMPEDDDWDPEAEEARFLADLEAGRARIPEEWEIECRPPVTISLGDAAGADPARLGDNELLGAVAAARRLTARGEHLELRAIAEFTRRQDARYQAAVEAWVPPGRRDGEFADAELGMELITSPNAARDRMDQATALQTRLPATGAALAAGLIDGSRARIIWRHTRVLSGADAARADQVLAEAAPQLRHDQLARREDSGNACLNGRELAAGDVLASKAHIDAAAAALRHGGLQGSLRQPRVPAYLDLTQLQEGAGMHDYDEDNDGKFPDDSPVRGPLPRSKLIPAMEISRRLPGLHGDTLSGSADTPQVGAAVGAAGGQRLAVRAEGDGDDRVAGFPAERRSERSSKIGQGGDERPGA